MNYLSTKALSRVALLVSLSIVIKLVFSATSSSFRITFYEIPIIISGLLYGPIIGGVTGFIVDVLYILFHPMATSFNLMTVSSMMWGIMGGVLLFGKMNLTLRRLLLMIVSTSILTFVLNSIQLYVIWEVAYTDLPIRIGILLVKIPIQYHVLKTLFERVILPELKF